MRLGRASYSGLFRVEATEVAAQRNLRNPRSQSLRLQLEVLWEPRVTPLLIQQAYRNLQLNGDDGSPIRVAAEDGNIEVPVQNTLASVDLVVPLEAPPRSVQRIARLKGTLTALLPGREESFEFTDLEAGHRAEQPRSGLTVILERVRKSGSVYEFRVRLRLPEAGDAFQSHLGWAANNTAYLQAPDGQRLENPNLEQYLERDREIGFAYLFPIEGDLKGYRFVYRSPTASSNKRSTTNSRTSSCLSAIRKTSRKTFGLRGGSVGRPAIARGFRQRF